MNRTQRRQAERDARRGKVYHERVVPLPALLDEFTVFDMPQTMLDKLINGEIESVHGVPVFYDNEGGLNEICPALQGWIYTWQRINEKLNANIDLAPLQCINNKLNADSIITMNEVMAARQSLDGMRKFFRSTDRKAVCEITKTAQIAMLLEQA